MRVDARIILIMLVAIIAIGIPLRTSAQDQKLGIVYTSIGAPHKIYLLDAQIWWEDQSFVKYLSKYPRGILPSGGNSGIVSASEMVAINLQFDNEYLRLMPVKYRFFGINGNVIYEYQASNQAYAAFIGHFDWEINQPGYYWIEIDTPVGYAIIRYEVRP